MALNNETIVNDDLVAWVMMGIQHLPRSEVRVSYKTYLMHKQKPYGLALIGQKCPTMLSCLAVSASKTGFTGFS